MDFTYSPPGRVFLILRLRLFWRCGRPSASVQGVVSVMIYLVTEVKTVAMALVSGSLPTGVKAFIPSCWRYLVTDMTVWYLYAAACHVIFTTKVPKKHAPSQQVSDMPLGMDSWNTFGLCVDF